MEAIKTYSETHHHVRDRTISMRESLEISNVFITLSLIQVFWKTEPSSKKLEYCFIVERTTIENAILLYQTILSKAKVKTSRMECTKWTYHKERSFVSN